MTDVSEPSLVGADAETLDVAHRIIARWDEAGIEGAFLARHLGSGREVGFGVDRFLPLASLVKRPLALAVLDAAHHGRLGEQGLGRPIEVDPATLTRGRCGVAALEHPGVVALGDLVTSALTVSDNAAADLLFDLVPPSRVSAAQARWGLSGIVCRHRIRDLHEGTDRVAVDETAALELAVLAATRGGGHAIAMLDVAAANVGTAAALVHLLTRVWTDAVASPAVCAHVRRAMAAQLTSRRIVPELASDAVRVAAKTGTYLNLRHDAAVVETRPGPGQPGETVVVVALTQSRVPVATDPGADLAIGAAARLAVDVLRE